LKTKTEGENDFRYRGGSKMRWGTERKEECLNNRGKGAHKRTLCFDRKKKNRKSLNPETLRETMNQKISGREEKPRFLAKE